MTEPRRFHLLRHHDVSGVSGTGIVADGIIWPDGTASLRWRGERPSTVHWDRIADAKAVHGHGGATEIVLDDAADRLRDRAASAIHEDRLTWSTGHTLGSKSPVVVDDQEKPSVLIETWAPRLEAVNAYLALLGPATGLALADWLTAYAGHLAATAHPEWQETVAGPALAVARAILGSQP
jgi:hypothetical protein